MTLSFDALQVLKQLGKVCITPSGLRRHGFGRSTALPFMPIAALWATTTAWWPRPLHTHASSQGLCSASRALARPTNCLPRGWAQAPRLACTAVLCAAAQGAGAQTAGARDLWFTLHGDPQEPHKNLIEVRPEPVGIDQRVMLDLRVSRDQMRTSFRGQKYRSYYAKAVVNCSNAKAWYLWLSYYAQPRWAGTWWAGKSTPKARPPFCSRMCQASPTCA